MTGDRAGRTPRPARAPRPALAPRPTLALAAVAAVALAFLTAPLVALAWRVPWRDAAGLVGSRALREALLLSVATSAGAAALAAALGLPLAWVLARWPFPGRRVVRALTALPLVLPPVVSGVALLALLGRSGVAGQWLDRSFGLRLPFTTAAVVLAQAFVALPFVVLTAEAAFRSADSGLEEAARTLGARPASAFARVTLPTVLPSLAAGLVLGWARALGEFGATVTFAGNFPGRTQTVPLKVFLLLESDPGAALVLSLVLLAVSLAVLVALRGRWLAGLR